MEINHQSSEVTLWTKLIDDLSHKLNTPLAALSASFVFIEKVFPELLNAHEIAIQNCLLEPKQSRQRLQLFKEKALPNTNSLLKKANTLLAEVYNWNQKITYPDEDDFIDIITCINTIIEKSNKNDSQKFDLKIPDEQNFIINIERFFVEKAIHHLINIFLSAQANFPAKLHFWAETTDKYHELHIKCDQEISKDNIDIMLESFFCEEGEIIAPGMGYCQLAFIESGGNILVNIIKNEYTQFTLKFLK